MQYSLGFHIVGIVFWMGGLIIVSRFLALLGQTSGGEGGERVRIARRLWLGYVLPGAAITILSGLHQLGVRGFSFYFSQGWFHSKITAVVILLVVTFLFGRQLSRIQSGQAANKGQLMMIHGTSALLLIVIVFLTKLSV